jgi:predicted DNA-binding mobile mystery protein A
MKRIVSQSLRLNQLSERPAADRLVREVETPIGGWLKAIRQALGLTLKSVGDRIDLSPQSIHQFEKSEASGAISLKQLQVVAGAMGCRVVYAIMPTNGMLTDLATTARTETVKAVQQSMSLEGQAVKHPEKLS